MTEEDSTSAEPEPKSYLDASQLRVVSKEPIPTIVVHGWVGSHSKQHEVRINLYEERHDVEAGEVVRYITARLSFPRDSFYGVVSALARLAEDQRREYGPPEGVE